MLGVLLAYYDYTRLLRIVALLVPNVGGVVSIV